MSRSPFACSVKLNPRALGFWDSTAPNGLSNIVFTVFHEGTLQNKCLGQFSINMGELLERQCSQPESGEAFYPDASMCHRIDPGADIILPLVDKKGNATGGFLAVRAVEHSASNVISALEQARSPNQDLEEHDTEGKEPGLTLTNTLSGQKTEPVLDSVLSKLETLLQVGDEIAKVRTWLSLSCRG